MFNKWKTWKLQALYRIAKSRVRVWFTDPHVMMELREEIRRRG